MYINNNAETLKKLRIHTEFLINKWQTDRFYARFC